LSRDHENRVRLYDCFNWWDIVVGDGISIPIRNVIVIILDVLRQPFPLPRRSPRRHFKIVTVPLCREEIKNRLADLRVLGVGVGGMATDSWSKEWFGAIVA
jgi:hypothetical protein